MWYGNYEDKKSRFVPIEGEKEVKWPERGFHADASGGYGEDCFGTRYEVLNKNAPEWQAEVLATAVKLKMPLVARKIGKAGKYSFWVLCGASAGEAQEESERLMNTWKKRQEAAKLESLLSHSKLPENCGVLTPDGDVILAQAVSVYGRNGYFGGERLMVVDGKILSYPEGAKVVQF